MSDVVRVTNLSRRFGGGIALDGVSFDVAAGSIYGLIGPNGAGKTTTLKILMNILAPSAGRTEVCGTDSRRLTPAVFQRIGYVSENQELPGWMTVGYFLQYVKGFYPTWDEDLAGSLVSQFRLPLDRHLKHLSRGMRMKVALASSLAYRPELLVLDEPFSGLDPLVRDEFITGLVASALETTILISSHDLAEIESFVSHVGYLDDGHLRFSESLPSLTDRFREVELTLAARPRLPADWPRTWLCPETSATVVRFVDSAFEERQTVDAVERLFGAGARFSVAPMSLRAIVVTLARSSA